MYPVAECAASETVLAVRRFIESARRPAILEPGEDLYEIAGDNYRVSSIGGAPSIQVWDASRHMSRRISGAVSPAKGGLTVPVKRLMRADGELLILDLALPGGLLWRVRSRRLAFEARFRHMLAREYPGCDIREITTEKSQEQGISGEYPRARLRVGDRVVAAVAEPEGDGTVSAVLGVGLCWLAQARRAEGQCAGSDLALFVPTETCDLALSGLEFVDIAKTRCYVYVFDQQGHTSRVEHSPGGGPPESRPLMERRI